MIYTDCHLHSSFSSDSEAPLESMVLRGIDLGLRTMCITEHIDYDYPENSEGLSFLLDFDAYKEELFRLKEKYHTSIELLFGIEMGLMPYLGPRYQKIADSYPFDFIIGSSHLVDGIDPYEPEYYDRYGAKQGLMKYFESIYRNITAPDMVDFDVYGHLDYAVRYAPEKNAFFQFRDYQEIVDEILKILIRKDKGIEVNASGYKAGLGVPNPHPDILCRYKELGGEILTIGSDGHKPEHMAYDYEKLYQLLKSLDIHSYTIFKNRNPIEIPL